MTAKTQTFSIARELLTPEKLSEIDDTGYYALDAWNSKIAKECLFSLHIDPWDYLGFIRRGLKKTQLRVTLAGQALIGNRFYSDEIVDAFIAALSDKGTNIVRIYDALNDPRNLETALNAVKKYGMTAEVAMIFAEIPVYSPSFFAGYAAQLAAMGADSVAVCGLEDPFITRELVTAVNKAVDIPILVGAVSEEICDIALDAGADFAELFDNPYFSSEFGHEIENILSESGFPPMAEPISDIIYVQALNNLGERYSKISSDFKDLILGKFGRTPAPIDREFAEKICGDEPAVLVRPADLIDPEYDDIRERIAPYFEDEEDVLTYAIFGEDSYSFFEYRKAKKYSLDLLHCDPDRGIHTV